MKNSALLVFVSLSLSLAMLPACIPTKPTTNADASAKTSAKTGARTSAETNARTTPAANPTAEETSEPASLTLPPAPAKAAPELASATRSPFDQPWADGRSAIVIDPYHANPIDWDKMAADKRVVAIIHKATEGARNDRLYKERKAEALRRGYLWGSYHLGRPGDPIVQADYYLDFTQPDDNELIALDLEEISDRFMSLENARKFILHIKEKTGRYPVLYTNHSTTRNITKAVGADDVFANCPLWYARFIKKVKNFPVGTWNTYALWQFSSEINCKRGEECLYAVPGTKTDMDVNVFNGDVETLKQHWPLTHR